MIPFLTLLPPSPFVLASFLPQVKTHPISSKSFTSSRDLLCPSLLPTPPAPFILLVLAVLRVVASHLKPRSWEPQMRRKLMMLVFLGLGYFTQNDLL